ncbi:MAG: PGN_0703 family putative restriction endonuclease [Myxococcota bacterium]
MSHTAWYTRCRLAQERWKREALPPEARAPGRVWVDTPRGPEPAGPYPIALPEPHARLNLLASVREAALARFERHGIPWHNGTPAQGPTTHLLDSQVQCVNVLLTMDLLAWVRTFEPEAVALLDVEDESPVAFEWIGDAGHLGEARTRGRFATSADAYLLARRRDGVTAVLVEWKFTEHYDRPVPLRGPGGRDRREIYRARYEASEAFSERPPIEAFFHEPHYQLLRLVLLAEGMVRARERGADRAVVVHVLPEGNADLLATVPPALGGGRVDRVWEGLVKGPRVRFTRVDGEDVIRRSEAWERYRECFRTSGST